MLLLVCAFVLFDCKKDKLRKTSFKAVYGLKVDRVCILHKISNMVHQGQGLSQAGASNYFIERTSIR